MSLSPYLVNVALHAVLLSAAVSLALVFVRRPARRAALAMAAMLGVGVLPWVSALLPGGEAKAPAEIPAQAAAEFAAWRVVTIPASDFPVSAVQVAGATQDYSLPSAWTLAAWAWLGGTSLALALTALGLARLARWRASLRRPDAYEAALLVAAMPAGLGMRQIRLSEAACSPCVTGFMRPLLVVPDGLLESCSGRELNWVLRHEQAHLTGRDSRWILLMALVRALFWWDPFVHHLAKHWAASREEVCDLHAGAADRESYGDFLIRMAATCPAAWRLAAPMVGGAKRRMKKRLISFLNAPERGDLRVGHRFIAAIALALPLLGLCSSCVRIGESDGQVSPVEHSAPTVSDAEDKEEQVKVPLLQVKLSTRVLTMEKPLLTKNGEVLSPDELKKVLVKAATTKGALLVFFPVITMRNRESGTIEMIREKPLPAGQEPVTAGWELRQTARFDGKSLRLGNRVRYAYVPGKQFSPTSRNGYNEEPELSKADWAKLVVKAGDSEAKVPEGYAVVTTLGEVAPGMHSVLITEVEPIDATGRTLRRYRDAVHSFPAPELDPCKVRVHAELLDGEDIADPDRGVKFEPLPDSWMVGLFNRDQWKLVKDGVKAEDLGKVTLATGKAARPWKKIPELQLEAMRYKGDRAVSLDLFFIAPKASPYSRFVRQAVGVEVGTTIVIQLSPSDGKPPGYLGLTVEGVE